MRRRKALDPGQGILLTPIPTNEANRLPLAPRLPIWVFERLDSPDLKWFIDGNRLEEDGENFYVYMPKGRKAIPKATWKRIR